MRRPYASVVSIKMLINGCAAVVLSTPLTRKTRRILQFIWSYGRHTTRTGKQGPRQVTYFPVNEKKRARFRGWQIFSFTRASRVDVLVCFVDKRWRFSPRKIDPRVSCKTLSVRQTTQIAFKITNDAENFSDKQHCQARSKIKGCCGVKILAGLTGGLRVVEKRRVCEFQFGNGSRREGFERVVW